MKDKKERIWKVSFNESDSYNYYSSSCKTVIAEDMWGAMEKVKSIHADAIFVSINHHGAVDIK